ncbi:hypothetical protein NKJ86_10840 [Mesorhizobium sp. M0025]|uniref:hypothetical protein n=1 Tax=Mesorhizobium sp. M0025 TaxID=2956846 RepID=UPI003339DD5D
MAVDKIEQVSVDVDIDTVVCCYNDLKFDDLHTLYTIREEDDAPLLVLATNECDLLARVEHILNSPPLTPSEPAVRVALYPPQSRAINPDIEHALARAGSARSLYLSTMSDGLDAYLGRYSLCGLKGEHVGEHRHARHFCLRNDYCYRQDMQLNTALESDALLSASDLTAPFIFFAACWGLLPGDAVDVADHSLLESWLRSGRAELVITTWELTLGDLTVLERVFDNILAGASPRRAVAEFNRSIEASRTGIRVCIIGQSPTSADVLASRELLTAGTVDEFVCGDDPKQFLRTYIARVLSQESPVANRADWITAFDLISDPDSKYEAQAAIAKAIANYSTTAYSQWLFMAVPEPFGGYTPCPNCLTRSSVLSIVCASDPLSRRSIIKCPRCGIALDKDPLCSVSGVSLVRDQINIALAAPIANYVVWCTVEHFVGSRLTSRKLGSGTIATETLSYTLDLSELQETRWVSVTVISEWRLAVARLPGRTAQSGEEHN